MEGRAGPWPFFKNPGPPPALGDPLRDQKGSQASRWGSQSAGEREGLAPRGDQADLLSVCLLVCLSLVSGSALVLPPHLPRSAQRLPHSRLWPGLLSCSPCYSPPVAFCPPASFLHTSHPHSLLPSPHLSLILSHLSLFLYSRDCLCLKGLLTPQAEAHGAPPTSGPYRRSLVSPARHRRQPSPPPLLTLGLGAQDQLPTLGTARAWAWQGR